MMHFSSFHRSGNHLLLIWYFCPEIRYVDAILSIPKGTLFPMCGMNLAFDRELIGPAMYFGLMGDGQPIGRYDDMWAGWCTKVFSVIFFRIIAVMPTNVIHGHAQLLSTGCIVQASECYNSPWTFSVWGNIFVLTTD
jgi:hypothetical protein